MAKISCTWCILFVAFAVHCMAAEPAGVREEFHLSAGLGGTSAAHAADEDSLVDQVLVEVQANTGDKKGFVNQVLVETNGAEHAHSSEDFGELKLLGARLDGLIPAEDNRVNNEDFPALETLSTRLSGMMKEPAMEPVTVMVKKPTKFEQPPSTMANAVVGTSELPKMQALKKQQGAKKGEEKAEKKGEKKEEGAKEEEKEDLVNIFTDIPTVNLWAFSLIVTFLVFFTLVFEHSKEHIEHMVAGSANQPIVQSIFGELTVLGFLALLCFLLNKWGLDHLSTMIFGKAEPDDKEKLGEMLESIHMVIFLVMVVFVMEAIGMLWIAGRGSAEWGRKEEQMLTPCERHECYSKFEVESASSSCTAWFGCSSKPQYKLLQFLLMRQEFINDELEDEETRKKAEALNIEPKGLRDDFSFTVYLEKVMGERLGEVVRLDVFQWITLELAVLFFIVATITISKGSWLFLLVIWLSWSWFLVLVAHLFLRGLLNVQQQLMHDQDGKTMKATSHPEYVVDETAKETVVTIHYDTDAKHDPSTPEDGTGDSVNSSGGGSIGSGNGASSTEDNETSLLVEDAAPNTIPSSLNTRTWINEVPRYQLDESLDTRYTWVPFRDQTSLQSLREEGWTSDADGTNTPKPGAKADVARNKLRFYNLFLFGKNEINFQLYVIRFFFLGTAVYCSVYFLHIVPTYVIAAYSTPGAILLIVAGLLPSVLLYTYYITQIIEASVLVTSVEYFRHRRQVQAVEIHQKEDRTVLMLRLMVALHDSTHIAHNAEGHGCCGGGDEHDHQDDHDHEAVSILDVTSEAYKKEVKQTKQLFEQNMNNNWLDVDFAKHNGKELFKMGEIFDNLDTDHTGTLSHKEIIKVLDEFGLKLHTQAEYDAELKQAKLDADAKNDTQKNVARVIPFLAQEHIEKAAFVVFMKAKLQEAKYLSGHTIAKMCFHTFHWDEDMSNQLSVEELQIGLRSCGEAFTPNEVTSLMVKLDVNDDGEFSLHEFQNWIDQHSVAATEQVGVLGMGCFGF